MVGDISMLVLEANMRIEALRKKLRPALKANQFDFLAIIKYVLRRLGIGNFEKIQNLIIYCKLVDKLYKIDDDIADALKLLSKYSSDILKGINTYGRINNKELYIFYNNLDQVYELLNSPLHDTVINYIDIIKHNSQHTILSNMPKIHSYDSVYDDYDIDKIFGREYTFSFILMTAVIIGIELDKYISREEVIQIVDKCISSFNDKGIKEAFYDIKTEIDYRGAYQIIRTADESLTFLRLNTKFIDKDHWPFKDDLVEFLYSKLDNYNFSSKTLTKMNLLNTTTYNGMGLGNAISMMIFKRIVEYIISNKQEK